MAAVSDKAVHSMRKIALIGGDLRQISAARTLQSAGFLPFVFANAPAAQAGFTAPYTLSETLDGADAVLLPVPSVKERGLLYTPLSESPLPLAEFCRHLGADTTVFYWGARLPIPHSHRVVNLAEDEVLLSENARATAEVALLQAISQAGRAIFDSKAAVLGYGRIGSVLCRHLSSLGCPVKVGVRRENVRLEARKAGFSAFSLADPALFSDVDLIFNTIPATVVEEKSLVALRRPACYLELASAPGGLSAGAKAHPNLRPVDGGALPGRFCPESAGKFLAQAVICHLEAKGERRW